MPQTAQAAQARQTGQTPVEQAAAWMRTAGEFDAVVTSEMTVHGTTAVGLVVCGAWVTGVELDDLVGFAEAEFPRPRCYLFTDGGFPRHVVDRADEAGVALLRWTGDGAVRATGTVAAEILAELAAPAPVGRRRAAAPEPAAPPPAAAEPEGVEPAPAAVALDPVDPVDPVVPVGVGPVVPTWWREPLEDVGGLDAADPLFAPLTGEAPALGRPEWVPVDRWAPSAATASIDPVEPAESVAAVAAPSVTSVELVDETPRLPAEVREADEVNSAAEAPATSEAPTVAVATVADPEPEAHSAQPAGSSDLPQISRYLEMLHSRAAAQGSRAATRSVSGGPDASARSAASMPPAPIVGLTPEMIFPRQQPPPVQESIPTEAPASPTSDDLALGVPQGAAAAESTAERPRGSVKGWFGRRSRPDGPDGPDSPEGTERRVGVARGRPVARSYQMRRTLEARRAMLETGLPAAEDLPEVVEWLAAGDRARAIATYRKVAGVGLVEAIDAIDAWGDAY